MSAGQKDCATCEGRGWARDFNGWPRTCWRCAAQKHWLGQQQREAERRHAKQARLAFRGRKVAA